MLAIKLAICATKLLDPRAYTVRPSTCSGQFRQVLSSVAFLFLGSTSIVIADTHNWPNFRGPHGNGVAPDSADPPIEFGPDKNLKWKVALPGQGHSSPVVWEDRIYLMSAVPTSQEDERQISSGSPSASGERRRGMGGMNHPKPNSEYEFKVLCIHRDTGEIIWNTTVTRAVPHEGGHRSNTYASASPVTDGRHLWCHFGSQGVWCLNLQGEVVWNLDLGKMVTRNQFGEGASMAVYQDVAVIPWDQEQNSFVLAVNALTGEQLWKNSRDEVTSWATPTIVEHDGSVQVVTNGTTIRSYDLKSGNLLWESGGQTTNPIPTPLIYSDSTICMTGHRGFSIQSISLSAKGDVGSTNFLRWKRADSAPYISSPTLVKDSIYLVKGNSGILSSVNARDGSTIMDSVRLPGIEQMYASLISAADYIYACGRSGEIVVFKHGNEYQQVHQVNLGEPIDATPAISGNLLIIRGHQSLYCFEKPSKS